MHVLTLLLLSPVAGFAWTSSRTKRYPDATKDSSDGVWSNRWSFPTPWSNNAKPVSAVTQSWPLGSFHRRLFTSKSYSPLNMHTLNLNSELSGDNWIKSMNSPGQNSDNAWEPTRKVSSLQWWQPSKQSDPADVWRPFQGLETYSRSIAPYYQQTVNHGPGQQTNLNSIRSGYSLKTGTQFDNPNPSQPKRFPVSKDFKTLESLTADTHWPFDQFKYFGNIHKYPPYQISSNSKLFDPSGIHGNKNSLKWTNDIFGNLTYKTGYSWKPKGTQEGTFLALIPLKICPGLPYSFSLKLFTSSPATVGVYLEDWRGRTIIEKQVTITRHATITLPIPVDLPKTRYFLSVRGLQGVRFSGRKVLKYENNAFKIFIQTDKSVYDFSQAVKYRVFGLFPNMHLYKGAYDVSILDPRGNILNSGTYSTDEYGVWEGSLQLSSDPVVGEYKIAVQTGTITRTKRTRTFTVKRFHTPKFDAHINLPAYILETENKVKITITATYTQGKPVYGRASVRVGLDQYAALPRRYIQQTVQLEEKAELFVSVKELRAIAGGGSLAYRQVVVQVNVTEGETHLMRPAVTKTMMIYDRLERLAFSDLSPAHFKPGLTNTFYFEAQNHDGSPLAQPRKMYVTAKVEVANFPYYPNPLSQPTHQCIPPSYTQYSLPDQNMEVPQDGIIPIHITPYDNATRLWVECRYGNDKSMAVGRWLQPLHSPSYTFLAVSVQSTQLYAGESASFLGTSNREFETLSYMVLSRGRIVDAGLFGGRRTKSRNFYLNLTPEMAPFCRLVVYYKHGKEIVADALAFRVSGLFTNKVDVRFTQGNVYPGSRATLSVRAGEGSRVFTLAGDHRLSPFAESFDVRRKQILRYLTEFLGGFQPPSNVDVASPSPRSLSVPGIDLASLFKTTGVGAMSDCLIFKYKPQNMCPVSGSSHVTQNTYFGAGSREVIYRKITIQASSHTKLTTLIPYLSPSTWMWESYNVDSYGFANFTKQVPDILTSYSASAFAISKNNKIGFGIAATTATLKTHLDFYVVLDYARTVIQGEDIIVQATIFNNFDYDLKLACTLFKSEHFAVLERTKYGYFLESQEDVVHKLTVRKSSTSTAYFFLRTMSLGHVQFLVRAQADVVGESAKGNVFVEANGMLREFSQVALVDLRETRTYTQYINVAFPEYAIGGSQKLSVIITGDVLGCTLHNLERLVSVPHGCGEQVLVHFSPMVYIRRYLEATLQMAQSTRERIDRLLVTGYQREMAYRRSDGSFSAFREHRYGSTWLTAYVARCFFEARRYVYIDDQAIRRALDFVASRQLADGTFSERGVVLDHTLVGASFQGDALTAFVLISLLNCKDYSQYYQSNIARASRYLESRQSTYHNQPYDLAITAYALTLAGSSAARSLLQNLQQNHLKTKDGLMYWETGYGHTADPTRTTPLASRSAVNVETAAYALLAYTNAGDYSTGLPILRWLLTQQNPRGGFVSTQDTSVALHAISLFAEKTLTRQTDLHLTVGGCEYRKQYHVQSGNVLDMYKWTLPEVRERIKLEAKGTGLALVQVTGSYYVKEVIPAVPHYAASVQVYKETAMNVGIKICMEYLQRNTTSGVAVAEVGTPSGFQPVASSLDRQQAVRRYEVELTKTVLYFDRIESSRTCVSLEYERVQLVARTAAVALRVYSYYDPRQEVITYFQLPKLNNMGVCDICTTHTCHPCQKLANHNDG